MSAEYVRRTYGVTAKRGDRVTVNGRAGTIVSFPGAYLGVRFDGQKHTSRCHPTWRVEATDYPAPPVQPAVRVGLAKALDVELNTVAGYFVEGSHERVLREYQCMIISGPRIHATMFLYGAAVALNTTIAHLLGLDIPSPRPTGQENDDE